ncbi:hypothetical protein ACQJBY_069649 [Aegilops geniculata]
MAMGLQKGQSLLTASAVHASGQWWALPFRARFKAAARSLFSIHSTLPEREREREWPPVCTTWHSNQSPQQQHCVLRVRGGAGHAARARRAGVPVGRFRRHPDVLPAAARRGRGPRRRVVGRRQRRGWRQWPRPAVVRQRPEPRRRGRERDEEGEAAGVEPRVGAAVADAAAEAAGRAVGVRRGAARGKPAARRGAQPRRGQARAGVPGERAAPGGSAPPAGEARRRGGGRRSRRRRRGRCRMNAVGSVRTYTCARDRSIYMH